MDSQALDLANKTLAAAIDSLMTMGSPFLPIVFVEKNGQRELRRVAAGRAEDAAGAARQMAATEPDADATAFAVDGIISLDGARYDALVVEAWNFSTSRGARIGLRYELKGLLRKKPSLIGSPLHRGREGWFDPEGVESESVEPAPSVAPMAEPAPATSGPAPLEEAEQPAPHTPVMAGWASPVADTAPPTAAHPVDVASAPQAPAASTYLPVPIQRSETPLGNRAMFTGIMELATKGRSFPAFAIVQKEGAWEQVTMTDAGLMDAAASVRAYARTRTDAEFIAFAIDGFVPVGDAEVEAVIVEVWEYATRVSFSVAQRYIPTGTPPSPRLSGRPLMRTQAGWVDVPSSMMLGGQVQFGYRDPDPV